MEVAIFARLTGALLRNSRPRHDSPFPRQHHATRTILATTALYRLAFGQPRQSDLLAMLETAEFDEVAREQLLIRLAPPVVA